MSKDKKGLHTGIIEKDENGNFFCGPYLLDYQRVTATYKEGDKIVVNTVIDNPSDKSLGQYPQKSKDFSKADKKFIPAKPKEE
jgi:hypothetical protein